MTTLLNTFTNSEIKVRFKEPFLTQGLNQKLYSVQPAGAYRGFNLTTSVNLLRIVVQADVASGDHVAVYGTADGYALTLRKTGDFEIDLTSLASKTVVIALYADYTLNKDTSAEVRAYELSPVDEYTSAPELSELIVLGTVVVPAAGLIPAADITPNRRTSAWQKTAPEARVWHQVIQNGSFEVAKAGAIGITAESDFPGWVAFGGVLSGSLAYSIDQVNPRIGSNCLKITGDGSNTGETQLYQEQTLAIIPGARVRAAMWVAGDTVSAGGLGATGYLAISIFFYGHDFGLVGSIHRVCNAGQLDGTFAYQEFSETLTAPATAEFVSFGISAFDKTAVPGTMIGSYFVDDVRVWVEALEPTADDLSERPLNVGTTPQESLDISAFTASSSMDDFLAKILRLRYADEVGGIKEYEWKHRKGALDWLLKLVNGGVRVERAIEALGTDLIGSSATGALPRITTPIPVFTTARYVLLWEVQKVGSAGNFRMYASDAAARTSYTDDTFCFTFNAKWNGSNWIYDISLEAGFRVDICKDRISVLSYPASSATPWADANWDAGGAVGSEHLRVERSATFTSILTLLGKALISRNIESLGSAIVGSAADAALPRIQAPFPTGTSYTLMWEMTNAGPDASTRFYACDNGGIVGGDVFSITMNAAWNGTQWIYDRTNFMASRFDISKTGFAFYVKEASTTSPWSDTDWDDRTESFDLLTFVRNELGQATLQMFARLTLQLAGTIDETTLETSRIFLPMGANGFQPQHLIEAASVTAGLSRLRVLGYPTSSGLSSLDFLWNTGYNYNAGTPIYSRDSAADHSSRFSFLSDGAFVSQYHDRLTGPPSWGDPWYDLVRILTDRVTDPGTPSVLAEVKNAAFNFTAATLAGSNRTNPIRANILCAANTVKAWANFRVGFGTVNLIESYGIVSVTYDQWNPILTFHQAMDTNDYAVVISSFGEVQTVPEVGSLANASFTMFAMDHAIGGHHLQIDFSDSAHNYFMVVVLGRQS